MWRHWHCKEHREERCTVSPKTTCATQLMSAETEIRRKTRDPDVENKIIDKQGAEPRKTRSMLPLTAPLYQVISDVSYSIERRRALGGPESPHLFLPEDAAVLGSMQR